MKGNKCFPSQPIVVPSVWHITSDFSEKSESSLHKRRGLRNCEKGMEFLTCDGCEDEYNK